jgi:hypothetical protein
VGRILNSETVADLPIQQSTTVGLTLNLETAKRSGAPMKLSSKSANVAQPCDGGQALSLRSLFGYCGR